MREILLTVLILIAAPFVRADDPNGSGTPCASEQVAPRSHAAS